MMPCVVNMLIYLTRSNTNVLVFSILVSLCLWKF